MSKNSLKDIAGEYRMLGAYCTLIPTPAVAQRLYDILDAKKRVRSIDTEWTKLQQTGEVCSQVFTQTSRIMSKRFHLVD